MSKSQWGGILATWRMVAGPVLVSVAACGGAPSAQLGPSGATAADAASNDATDPAANAGMDDGGPQSNGLLQNPSSDGCTPVTACPPGVQCGRYIDPCSGKVLVCGAACASGNVCAHAASDPSSQSCQPKACATKCGVLGLDACGVPISCGGCGAGMDCINNQCSTSASADRGDAGQCASLTCTPDTQTHLCGNVTNGCGLTMACSCPAGTTCIGGVCGDPAPECSAKGGGSLCGSVKNACGSAMVNCGACPSGSQCVQGACATCAPPSCGTASCGRASNACGQSTNCGSCASGECYNGQCCTPMSCANARDGGPETSCDPVHLGCGITKSCAPCPAGEVCSNHKCIACVAKTCADFANAGCGHSDGCGKALDCCPQGTTCKGEGLCCAGAEVAYSGGCCQPSCDPAQAPGPQVSCGQTIFCAPGQKGPPR